MSLRFGRSVSETFVYKRKARGDVCVYSGYLTVLCSVEVQNFKSTAYIYFTCSLKVCSDIHVDNNAYMYLELFNQLYTVFL